MHIIGMVRLLKQIRALRSFGNVKKGQIGGWIESEDNLSHDGNCWIDYDCVVCGDTKVTGDIVVRNYLQFLYTVDQETLTIKPLRKMVGVLTILDLTKKW